MKFTEPLARQEFMAWLTDKYILCMLLVFPLFTGSEGYRQLTRAKFLFFAFATGIWLLALFCLALPGLLRMRRLPHPSLSQALILGFLAWACISALCSPYGGAVILGAGRYDGLVTLLLYGGIFLGISATGRPRQRYIAALAISTCLCCLIALLQILGENPLGLYPGSYTYYDSGLRYSGAFLGTIGNTNLLSAFLCLGIPLLTSCFVRREGPAGLALLAVSAFGFFILSAARVAGGLLAIPAALAIAGTALLRSRRGLWRAAAAGAVLACAGGLGLSLSAETGRFSCSPLPLLFLPCAAAALAIAWRQTWEPRPRIGHRLALALCAAIAAALAALWFWTGSSGTLYEFHQLLHGHLEDSFGSSRIRIWRETLSLVQERPWLGGGPDSLPLRLNVRFSRYVPETGKTLRTAVDNAHNELLGYWVNLGLPALGFYLATILATLRRRLRRGGASLPAILACCLLAYWIQSFFGLGLCIVVPMVWVLWGLAEARLPTSTERAFFATSRP